MKHSANSLRFCTIRLEEHQDLAIEFRADSFLVSFGNTNSFYEVDGQGHLRYLEWLRKKISTDPRFAVHVWLEERIIGQIELGQLKSDTSMGYVNLYYLIPEMRGTGFSMELDRYAMDVFQTLGLQRARLSVAPTNSRALKFYEKMGWTRLGQRPDHPEVMMMEKLL